LEAQVRAYLDAVGERVGREVQFNWEGDTYNAVSDLIIVRNAEAMP